MHVAVITEYNPFHKGHEYQLCELRKAFPDACITAIMGGIFSQRGEPYVTTPYVRGEAALECGADLCIELPFPFSCAPARIFARAGVEIAAKIGADILAFGSECGDLDLLQKMLLRLDSDEMKAAVEKESAATAKTRAYSAAYKKLYGEGVAEQPNDILALEYLRAIKQSGCKTAPYTIKRVGSYKGGAEGFPSATELRKNLDGGIEFIRYGVPQKAYEIYKAACENGLFGNDSDRLSSAVLMKLAGEISPEIAFSGGGIGARLQSAARNSKTLADIIKNASTKRFTRAELPRSLLYILLDVTRSDLDEEVHYTRLFAANSKGREVLKSVRGIEVVTKPSATETLSEKARTQYEKTFIAERAFALCFDGDYEFTKQTPKVK